MREAVYPYLLRGLSIGRTNFVWALEITSVPRAKGFVDLGVLLDWANRKVLAHRINLVVDWIARRRSRPKSPSGKADGTL